MTETVATCYLSVNSKMHVESDVANCYGSGMATVREIRRANLRGLVGSARGGIKRFAEQAGLAPAHVSQMMNDTRAMGDSVARRIESAENLRRGWMDEAHGGVVEEAIPASTKELLAPPDKVLVRRIVGAKISAGSGSIIYDFEEIKDRTFDREWMIAEGLEAEHCILWTTDGESMAPKIEPGELVLVNMRERKPQDQKIFALVTDEGLRLKRLIKKSDNSWEISSDNPDKSRYPSEPYIEGKIAILGRVRWHAGSL